MAVPEHSSLIRQEKGSRMVGLFLFARDLELPTLAFLRKPLIGESVYSFGLAAKSVAKTDVTAELGGTITGHQN